MHMRVVSVAADAEEEQLAQEEKKAVRPINGAVLLEAQRYKGTV